jgi:hypothetical protein
MQVSICYALPQQQYLETIDVAEGTTVNDAIAASRLLEAFPDLDLTGHGFGIFAKLAKADTVLQAGDRIEIYRPLPRKPRNARDVADKKARIRAKKEEQNT